MRDSAIIYRDFMKAVRMLPAEKQGEAYEAYMLYAMDGEEYTGEDYAIAALIEAYKRQIESDREKYQAKCNRAKKLVDTKSERNRDDIDTTSTRNRDEIDTKSVRNRDDIVSDTVTVSKEKDSPKGESKEKEPKRRHGKHVLLTDAEFEKLGADYGEAERDEAIAFLDDHIELKGYKANSHNLALRKWVFDAVRENKVRKERLARDEAYLAKAPPGRKKLGIPEVKAGIQNGTDFDAMALSQMFGG